MFAKLYNTEVGQILVKVDEGDQGAEVRIFFEPEGLGVCSVSYNWPELEEKEQWDNADSVFERMNEDKCLELLLPILEEV